MTQERRGDVTVDQTSKAFWKFHLHKINSKTKTLLQVVCGFAMRLCLVCNNLKVGVTYYSNFPMAAKSKFPSRSLHHHWHSLHLSVLLIL